MASKASLKSKLIFQCFLALIFVAAMLFVPAGSLRFWQGWAYVAIIFVPMVAGSLYFYKHDPELVASRMQRKEKVREQKVIMRLANLLFFGCFLLPGLDHRYGWSRTPLWLTIVSQALALGSYLMTLWVMKANRFASRIIEVKTGQKVISSGPYRIVRHPMYLGAMVMFLFTPVALGSYWTLPAFALVNPGARVPPAQRRKNPQQGVARLQRIPASHPVSAGPLRLVGVLRNPGEHHNPSSLDSTKVTEFMNRKRPIGITIVAVFAIIAGLGEIVVGFTGNYLGILSKSIPPALSTVIIGAFYSLGGLSLLITRKKWGAVLSIIFIGAEILGRIYLVMTGIAPSHGTDALKIVVGGAIALALVLYIGLKWKSFI